MGALRVASATRFEVRKLTLKSSKTGEPLLALEGGIVSFNFGGIWRLRLDELRLEHPDLVVSPGLGEALGIEPAKAKAGGSGSSLGWGIGHLVVTGGHMRITNFGRQSPTVNLDFTADLRNFGVGGDTGKIEHAAKLEKITAQDARGNALLDIADADIRFTPDELFAGSRLRSVRIGDGALTVAQSLVDFLTPQPGNGNAAQPGSASPGWSVGSLQLDGMHVIVPDAPGFIGRVDFHISAEMQNLGASGTPAANAAQRLTVTDLNVATDREPRIFLFSAEEAALTFTIAGLSAHRIEEVSFGNPAVDFSTLAMEAKTKPAAPAPAAGAAPEKPPAWIIGRATTDYGSLRLRGLKGGTLDVATKFSFDFRDLGTLGQAANAAQELTVWDAQASSGDEKAFVSFDIARVGFTTSGLIERQHVDSVKIDGGRLLVGDALQKLIASGPAAAATQAAKPASGGEGGWSLGAVDVSGVRTRIEDKRPGVTDLHFTLSTALRNVSASDVSSQLLDDVQTVELADISLRSPLDPAAKILSLRSVFVRFTLRDLVKKHLREVVILRPSIYLSRDLFVYMERAAAPAGAALPPAAGTAASEPNWSVDHLAVEFGRLVIGSGGRSDVGLPMEFETTADNLSLDNLAALQLQTVLRVPKQSRDFADYQIAIEDVEGDLRFAYPPEKGEKNLVQKLDIAGVRWRQYRASKAWVAVTFDAQGINGEFGGSAYGGYLNGGFSFFFGNDSPWIGWIAGTGMDTQALTAVISPQNFKMTGPLDFEIQLDAFRKEIDRVRGVFHLTEPGRLKIGKLDDLLANIPPEWTAIKQSSTRIALENLRDFDYTAAAGDFWFVQSQGILNLDLSGPNGSRKFEVALHDGQKTRNKWQQGKLGEK